ncbi:hypothetical protein [Pedobacter agri]|uniref:Uncharacterized protein n=1 Tax=Pedobacter agri TaxID=454586 RepID=A0A9X3DBU9_9SPHI|nr:hypothetical protein [Pedobacter agri]MCX3264754.1 hypothetical protein [Pedobacter agri]
MNNTFNINRFGLLLKRQWLDFGKVYLGTLIILTGILVVAYWIFMPSTDNIMLNIRKSPELSFRYLVFTFLGFFFISIVASSYFINLGKKADSIVELMIPASIFEKFVSGVFYTSILSTSSFLLVFYLVDLAFVTFFNGQISHMIDSNLALKPAETIVNEVSNDTQYLNYFKYNLISPFTVTSIFLLGSIYFKRFHYIKTAIVVILFTVLWVSLTFYFMNLMIADTVWIGNQYWHNDSHIFLIFSLVALVVTIAFWITTYIRLKEKEV